MTGRAPERRGNHADLSLRLAQFLEKGPAVHRTSLRCAGTYAGAGREVGSKGIMNGSPPKKDYALMNPCLCRYWRLVVFMTAMCHS